MISIFFTVQIVLAIVIVILALLNKSSSMGFGAYSSSNDSVFGAKGPMDFLTKATLTVGFLFVLNTLTLVYLYNKQANTSVVDEVKVQTTAPKHIPSIPSIPTK